MPFSFAAINSRSLMPKIRSLAEVYEEYDLSVCVVTETWLTKEDAHNEALLRLQTDDGIGNISFRRPQKRGSRNPGGGVSITFRTSKINLQEYKIKRSKYELVTAKGKIPGNTRPFYVIGAYMPPSMSKEKADDCLTHISDACNKIKTEETYPYIYIAGDFNLHHLQNAIDDYHDIQILHSPPS